MVLAAPNDCSPCANLELLINVSTRSRRESEISGFIVDKKVLKIHIGGRLVDESEAKISVFDHGLLYGDGVFEGIRSYNGHVFRLDEHLRRLWDSAKGICLEIPTTRDQMAQDIRDTLAANKIRDGYIRLLVTRGVGSLGMDPFKTSNPQVIIIADRIALYPEEYYKKGLKLITASTRRVASSSLNPRIKSLNYLNNILAKIEGIRAGCLETLMLNDRDEVSECTGDNIFIVRGGELITPPPNAGILLGVTRGVAMGLARQSGRTVSEAAMTCHDIYTSDECFLTGTAAEIVPVVELDCRPIGSGAPGPVTRDLTARFRQLIQDECSAD